MLNNKIDKRYVIEYAIKLNHKKYETKIKCKNNF